MEKRITPDEIMAADRFYRMHLINTIGGLRSALLIGTIGHRGVTNLGVFNSVTHLGATPPLLGFVMRPLTVPRHTYHNIKAKGYFTLNHIHPDFLEKAHQTSANYDAQTSEFSAVGLTPQFTDTHPAPYVEESRVKLGLKFVEEHPIQSNGTIFMVGKLVEILFTDGVLEPDGHLNTEKSESLAVLGLDGYYRGVKEKQLSYARPKNIK